jgi:uncharacterized protein (TIGR02145 family)
MKIKTKLLIYPIIVTVIILFFTESCKKKDDNNDDTTPPITVTDIDGNVYHTVKIGTQTWMVENLKTKRYRNGDSITFAPNGGVWSSTTTGAYCYYYIFLSNYTTYGCLYNYYAVNDSRNIAPTGWHVPRDTEWTTLTDYLGGLELAGGKLKETGITHWQDPNVGATNETGFTALPGGGREYIGNFDYIYENSYWWTSTVNNASTAYIRLIQSSFIKVWRYPREFACGFSVRCLKD